MNAACYWVHKRRKEEERERKFNSGINEYVVVSFFWHTFHVVFGELKF